jgi:hypothetical protein
MAKAIRFFHKGTTMFNGSNIAASYKLFSYQAGTTTKADTYTTAAKSVANANPMTLNADGRLDQDIYIDQSMKFVLATSAAGDPPSSSIWTIDNALSSEQVWTTVSKTANYTVLETDRDKLILVDATSGAVTIALLAAATAGTGFQIAIKKTDSSGNAVTLDGNSSETIDGAATLALSTQYDIALLTCDGSNWHVTNSAAAQSTSFTVDNATNNDVTNLVTIQHTTSGSPAAGIGAGILFNTESADEVPSNAGRLAFVNSDVTGASEDTYMDVQLRRAGAALASAYQFKHTGTTSTVITSAAATSDRTVTLPNADLTYSYSGGKATFAGSLTGDRTYTLPDADTTILAASSQAEMETGTATTSAVTPGRMQYHAGVAKMWAFITVSGGTPTLEASHNVTSITDTSAGNVTVTIATDFSTANYCAIAQAVTGAGTAHMASVKTGQAAGSLVVRTSLSSTGADTDNINLSVVAFGDQA